MEEVPILEKAILFHPLVAGSGSGRQRLGLGRNDPQRPARAAERRGGSVMRGLQRTEDRE
jgi:hypothetical protein